MAQQSGTVLVRPPGHPSLPIGLAMALATKRAATAKNFILNVVVVIQQRVDRCMCKRVVVIVREDADEDEEKKLVDDGEEGRLYTFFFLLHCLPNLTSNVAAMSSIRSISDQS